MTPLPQSDHRIEPVTLVPGANVMSVDVEDWYHLSCADMTRWLLDLFDQKKATATFFIVGVVAERMPDLIREIHARGHEVASHGWTHVPVHSLTPSQFLEHIVKSRNLLNAITDAPVRGFRAPLFSINRQCLWAFDVLAEAGIQYDSSIFPIVSSRYGIANFPRQTVRYVRNGASVIEIPLSTVRWAGLNWPVSGGGYFRLMPRWLIHRAVKAVSSGGRPFVVYCHPYEFAPQFLRHSPLYSPFSWQGSRRDEVKTNLFRGGMRRKLAGLLDSFTFSSFREVLSHVV